MKCESTSDMKNEDGKILIQKVALNSPETVLLWGRVVRTPLQNLCLLSWGSNVKF